MAKWSLLEIPDEKEADTPTSPTWGDWGSSAVAGAHDVRAMAAAAGRYLAERMGDDEDEGYYRGKQSQIRQDQERTMAGMSDVGRQRLEAAITSDAFLGAPFSSITLKALRVTPTMAAAIAPALLLPGVGGATAAAALTGGTMSMAQSLEDVYRLVDETPDEKLRAVPYYASLLELGMSPEDARRDYLDTIRGNAPWVNFLVGAITNAVGPAGQVSRAVKGGTAALGTAERGLAGRVGVGVGHGAGSEFVEEGTNNATTQGVAMRGGLQDEFNTRQFIDSAGEGALLGGVIGGAAGIPGGRRAGAPRPAAPTIEVIDPTRPIAQDEEAALTSSAPSAQPPAQPTALPAEVAPEAQPDYENIPGSGSGFEIPPQFAPAADPEVEPAPQMPGALDEEVPAPVAEAAKRVRAKTKGARKNSDKNVAEPPPVTSGVTPEAVTPEAEAPRLNAQGGRILQSQDPRAVEAARLQKEAQDAAQPQLVDPTPAGTKHLTEKELDQEIAAEEIFEQELPTETVFPQTPEERTALFERIDRTIKRAKADARIKIRVGAPSTSPAFTWLAEMSTLHKKWSDSKRGFRGAKADEAINTFLDSEAQIRGGDAESVKARRKSEGDAAKRQTAKASLEDAGGGAVTPEVLKSADPSPEEILASKQDAPDSDAEAATDTGRTEKEVYDAANGRERELPGVGPKTKAVLKKVKTLAEKGATEGERQAAQAALDRVQARINEKSPEYQARADQAGKFKVEAAKKPRGKSAPKAEPTKKLYMDMSPAERAAPKPTEPAAKKPIISAKVSEIKARVEAAAKKTETAPTDAQKKAGNYPKGNANVQGLSVSIENPKDSERSGTAPDGTKWSVKMPAHYGYVKRTEGADGDQVDVYVGPNPDSQHVLVIDQQDIATNKFDEHKVMLGFDDGISALDAYEQGFSDRRGFDRIQKITTMTMAEFKEWLAKGNTKAPAAELDAPAPAQPHPDTLRGALDTSKIVNKYSHSVSDRTIRGEFGDTVVAESRTTFRDAFDRWVGADEKRGASVYDFMGQRVRELAADTPLYVVDSKQMATLAPSATAEFQGAPPPAIAYHTDGVRWIAVTRDFLERAHVQGLRHVMIHEGDHIVTMDAVYTDPRIGHAAMYILQHMRNIHDQRNQSLGIDEKRPYGLSNVAELMAEVRSNPEFQKLLLSTELTAEQEANFKSMLPARVNRKIANLWDAFIEVVRVSLGLESSPGSYTALEAMFEIQKHAEAYYLRKSGTLGGVTRGSDAMAPAPMAPFVERSLVAIQRNVNDAVKRVTDPVQEGSPQLLRVRTMDQIAQVAERYFGGNNPVRIIADTLERMRIHGENLLKESEPIVTKLYTLERKYKGEQWDKFTQLVHDETMTGVDGSMSLEDQKLDSDALTKQWAKAHHADISARWRALPEDLKQARAEAMDYFRRTQNEMSLGIIRNRILRAMGIEDEALAKRIHTNNTTDADVVTVGGERVMELILSAKELGKIDGPYFPMMRRGGFVVRAEYKIVDPGTFIRKTDENTWEFATEDQAVAFGNAQATRPTLKKVYVDPTTGERFGVEADGTEVRLTKQDADAETRWRVTVQDKHVEFFDSKQEALDAQREYQKSGAFRSVAGAEPRRFEPSDRQADIQSNQLKHLMAAVENRRNFKDMSPGQRDELAGALNEISIRFLGSTRIQSRRLPRRYVEGASKDLTKNTLEYAQTSSAYLGRLKYAPTLEAALKDMNEQRRNDSAKGTSMGRGAIANEVDERIAARDSFPENTKMNRVLGRLLTTSFLDKLASPAYNIVNSLQVGMVSLPVLAARHGVGRAFAEISRAYSDVSALSIIGDGVRETGKKLKGELATKNYLESVKARLRNPQERAMLDALAEVGSIDPDAGLEIAALIRAQEGFVGKFDSGLSYLEGIARQMPRAIETINRTVTALAAYRLEMSKSNNHDKAVAQAQQVVNNTQGHYSNTNAAPLFSHPLFKLSLQFKKFGQMMYHLLGQELGKAFYGKSREQKIEGMKTLAYLATTHVAMAGALGLPTEPFKYMLLGAKAMGLTAVGWDDVEEWQRAKISGAFGAQAGELIAKGFPRAAGIDLSGRVGLDSLISFGEPKSDKKNDVKAYMFDLIAGAPGSLIGDWVSGANALAAGDVGKATELLVPLKFASDSIKAYRQATEGKKAESGRQLAKPYSYPEALTKMVGFTPAREAEQSAQAAAFRSQSTKAQERRTKLTNDWVNAKGADKVRAQRAVQEYNKSAPVEQRLTQKDLETAAKRRDRQGVGIITSKRTAPMKERLDQIYNVPVQ